MKSEKEIISPNLVLFVGIIAVSTASIFIRFAQENSSSLMIAAFRMAIASLILLPLALTRLLKRNCKIQKRIWLFLFLSGFFLALHFYSWITSLEYTTVTSSAVLVTTTPIWVALASPFVLNEKVQTNTIIGLTIALAGVITIAGSTYQFSTFSIRNIFNLIVNPLQKGNLLALIGAWFAAGYLLIGRKIRKHLDLFIYSFIVYSFAAFFLLTALITNSNDYGIIVCKDFIWYFLLALLPQVIGHSSFNWALGYLPAVHVSIAILGEPIGASILAWIFLKEIPNKLEIIGSVMIFCGIIVANAKSDF